MSIALMPDTASSRVRVQQLYQSVILTAQPAADVLKRAANAAQPPGLAKAIRYTACDAMGQFAFTGLPDGSWFVIAQVRSSPRDKARATAVMLILQPVHVQGSQDTTIRVPAF